jgi:hypothetical protein
VVLIWCSASVIVVAIGVVSATNFVVLGDAGTPIYRIEHSNKELQRRRLQRRSVVTITWIPASARTTEMLSCPLDFFESRIHLSVHGSPTYS